MAPSCPVSAKRAILPSAGSLTKACSGIGKGSGASSACQASVHADRSWRVYLPVRLRERTVWRELAERNFCFTAEAVSASAVVSQTEPVHTPCAPIAITAAICRPVAMPPAANTGISP